MKQNIIIGSWGLIWLLGVVIECSSVVISTNRMLGHTAHIISSALSILLYFVAASYWSKRAVHILHYQSFKYVWVVSIYWVLLTLGADLLLWHFLFRIPITTIVKLYYIWNGYFKALVLLTQIFAPYLMGKVNVFRFRQGGFHSYR